MDIVRRQLTLFISDQKEAIEEIRARFDPVQSRLIAAHVTLCREDEIEHLSTVVENLKSIALQIPIKIKFGEVERFAKGKGVLIPAKLPASEFHDLRSRVLKGLNGFRGRPLPHITLMHPRNATCTDNIFDEIKSFELPFELRFDCVSLTEQINNGRWKTLAQFPLILR